MQYKIASQQAVLFLTQSFGKPSPFRCYFNDASYHVSSVLTFVVVRETHSRLIALFKSRQGKSICVALFDKYCTKCIMYTFTKTIVIYIRIKNNNYRRKNKYYIKMLGGLIINIKPKNICAEENLVMQ